MNTIECYDLGRASYREIWELQKKIQKQLIDAKLRRRRENTTAPSPNDVLLFVEHPHVYTIGKSGNEANMLKSMAELKQLDAEFVKNDRGGDITYHGPGQLVGYPILDLDNYFTDIHKYLRFLEEVVIRTCSDYDISAGRIEGLTGVWVGDQKICAMGIRCSRWVTMHGFALNINTNLDYFSNIIPCGIQEKKVTSLQQLTGNEIDVSAVRQKVMHHFSKVFQADCRPGSNPPESEGHFPYLQDRNFIRSANLNTDHD